MPWALDTNIVVFCLRGKSVAAIQRILTTPADEISLPAQVKAELLVGALKSAKPDHNKSAVLGFIAPFKILWPDDATIDDYADIRVYLEGHGNSIGEADLWIAAAARSSGHVLVTNNTREFSRVPGLKLADWSLP